MTDNGRTVIKAALRASTYRALRPLGVPGAIAILAAVLGGSALAGWKARRAKKLARKRKAEADSAPVLAAEVGRPMTRATADREAYRYLRNCFVVALLASSVGLSACTQNETQSPTFSPSEPGFPTCASQLTEAACKERRGCRWINEHKRSDGTSATARCSGR
jgi:hypothetical protein